MKFRLSLLIAATCAVFCFIREPAYAGGFQIWDQSAADLGNYHAGAAANANDASTQFYNPAGMINLDHPEISVGLVNIMPSIRFQGSNNVVVNNVPFTSHSGSAQGGGTNLVPNFHYVQPIGDHWAFGMGLEVPFGLSTDYPANSAAADASTLTSIQVIDFSPGFAYEVTKVFSVGAGLDIQYAVGEFDQYILNDSISNNLTGMGLGYHIGLLWRFTDNKTRLGLTYHSRTQFKPSGNSQAVQETLSGGYEYANSTVSTNVETPAYTVLSLFHTFNQHWQGLATLSYTQWNTIQTIVLSGVSSFNIQTNTPVLLNVTLPQYYRNTWNVALGGNYLFNQSWMLRFGLGYDETPVLDAYRSLRLPDNDHYVVALGMQYVANANLRINAGYNHVFIARASLNTHTDLGMGNSTYVQTLGHVDGDANVFGLQFDWRF